MAICNVTLPWKHFRRAVEFTACESGHRRAGRSLPSVNGCASVYSVPVRPHGTGRGKSGLRAEDGRPKAKRVELQRGGRSKETQGLRRDPSAQRRLLQTRPPGFGARLSELEEDQGYKGQPTPQEHASLIAKVRRSLSEKHLVEAPQGLRMCTVLADSSQTTVRIIV